MDLTKYQHSDATLHPNLLLTPTTVFKFNDEGIAEFNSIYHNLPKELKQLKFTRSGGISISKETVRGGFKWAERKNKNGTCVELVVKDENCFWYRFQIRAEKGNITGRETWVFFKKLFKKFGVDFEKYAKTKEEGLRWKNKIPSPLTEVVKERYLNVTFQNAHHIDFNSSYAFGISCYYPALKKVLDYVYENRKKHPEYKEHLAIFHGACQSSICDYKYSHMSYCANKDNIDRMRETAKALTDNGRRILAFNTDGIWYTGEVYHDDTWEGTSIGQWKNDHVNCQIRFRGIGSYEYIENGVYHPVQRGRTTYERKVPKSEWVWGDIYKGREMFPKFDEEQGVTMCEI